MAYTGAVTLGGPPDVRELAHLVITKVCVGPMHNNAYFLRCSASGEELLIDAAAEPQRLIDTIGDGPLRTVVTTHAHRDHWGALADVVDATGAETLAHRHDADAIDVATTRRLDDGDVVTVGDVRLRVIHLVGHTPGSIALLYDDPQGMPHLFTGDSLFPGGPGKTTTTRDFTTLMSDLERKVFDALPAETWFYPGHGDDSTLGAEHPSIPEWRARGW